MKCVTPPSPEAILDALPDAVLAVTEATICWSNAAARALLHRGSLEGLPLEEILAEGELNHLRRLLRLWDQSLGHEGSHRIFLRTKASDTAIPVELRLSAPLNQDEGLTLLTMRDARHPAFVEAALGELAETSSRGDMTLEFERLLGAATPFFEQLGWTLLIFEDRPEGALASHFSSPLPKQLEIWEFFKLLHSGQTIPRKAVPLVAQLLESGDARFLDDFPHRLAKYGGAGAPYEKAAEEAGLAYAAWVPLRVEGEPNRLLIAMARDLTEYDFLIVRLFAAQLASAIRIERLSQALVRRERLAAVGEMSAVLAHEVRNPLGVLFNVAGGLRRLVKGNDSAARLVEILEEESARLDRLVSNLLNFARPISPTLDAVDLGALLEHTLESIESDDKIETAGRTVHTQALSKLPMALADRDLLRQALVNLATNAYQHTPVGGQLAFELRHQGDYLELQIRNDGPGIKPENQERIFQPFFTTRARGSGLGLAIALRTVEEMGGTLKLISGEPVCFSICLPVARSS